MHVICLGEDHFVHVFIVVANAEVQVEECLIWVVLELRRQSLHLFMGERDLLAGVFLLKQGSEGPHPAVRIVLLPHFLKAGTHFALLLRVEQGALL